MKEERVIEIQCPEEIMMDSKKYCIFHDQSPEKDVELFRQKIEEKLEKRDYNFKGFYFPEKVDFRYWIFEKDVDFCGAIFQKSADFWEVSFQGNACFSEVTFQKTANFCGTIFQKNADFWEVSFQESAYFNDAAFQDADFSGTTFQDAYFREATFQDAYFCDATFQYVYFYRTNFQYAYFFEATFQNADFRESTFQDADFRESIFQDADFCEVTFQDADFSDATFQYAYFFRTAFQKNANFSGAVIERNFEFTPTQIEELDLRYSQFLFKGHITADFSKIRSYRADIENVEFSDYSWPKKIYEEVHMKEENLTFKELETIYRDLKQNMQRHGNYSRAGKFYYREMEMRRKGSDTRKERIWLEFYRRLAGYGEKPQLVIRNSFLVILLAAILFFFWGVARVGAEVSSEEDLYIIDYSLHSLNLSMTMIKDFGYCLYYSVVTFTTLGYGDIHPLGYSHFLASAEALTGAFFMALFVVVFARKMMR